MYTEFCIVHATSASVVSTFTPGKNRATRASLIAPLLLVLAPVLPAAVACATARNKNFRQSVGG